MVQNKALIYKSVPNGFPIPGKDLVIETREIDLDQALYEGDILVKNLYASYDPYQRSRMRRSSSKSYISMYEFDQPMTAFSVSRVIKSTHPDFESDDIVRGMLPIEEYSVLPGASLHELPVLFGKLNNEHGLDLKFFLGALGMPGLTAYSSLYEIGRPIAGETIFVSAASGAVGSMVGQLAKSAGLTVIGSVGSDVKLKHIVDELRFDAGFNYKTENVVDALTRLAPKGIDIYYDNVGGEQLDAALINMNDFGRVVISGIVSQSSLPEKDRYGVRNLTVFSQKRLTMRGFIVTDNVMGGKYDKPFQREMARGLSDGTIKCKFGVTDGITHAAEGFVNMLTGKTLGKAVLKISSAV